MFEELAGVDAALELFVREEVVLAAVDLALPARPRGRGDRDDVAVRALQQSSDQRALPCP
jgi:hypothetical protein